MNALSPSTTGVLAGQQRGVAEATLNWVRTRRPANSWPLPTLVALVVVFIVVVQPQLDSGTSQLLATVFLYVALAQSWNLIGGYTGYASFGQVVFFGIGAYTTAVLMTDSGVSFWPTVGAAAGLGALFAVAIGYPLLRLRGHYFAIATLGVAVGIQQVATNLSITKGGAGITIPVFKPPNAPYPGADWFCSAFLVVAVATVLLMLGLTRSRFGYAMRSVHQDQDAAAAVGVNTVRVKVTAFAVSGAIAAAVGAFWAFQTVNFDPLTSDAFNNEVTVLMVIMVVLGGSGSVAGPIVGAVVLELLDHFLRTNVPGYSLLVLGAIIVAAVIFFPQGIVPFVRDAWKERRVSLLDNVRNYRL